MNKTILGIGLKRIGLILISVSLILFCYWCWQLHVLLLPINVLSDKLVDYDHIRISLVDVLKQIDHYDVKEFDGSIRTYYLYLVSVDTEDHGIVVYESRLSSVDKLKEQLPMTMDAEVFMLRGDKLELAHNNVMEFDAIGNFYPYQIKSLSYDVSSVIFSLIIILIGIGCYIKGRGLLNS